MRRFLLLLLFIQTHSFCQITVMSWNLNNLGKSKSEETLTTISRIIKNADIVAFQEIVTNPSGAQSLAKILEILNRSSGQDWDYTISDPTSSDPYHTERYAFMWKKNKVRLSGKAFLEPLFKNKIQREPYMATFRSKKSSLSFTLVNFHALPKKKQPEKEIKFFKYLPDKYPDTSLIFLGDFNIPDKHSVFNPLKSIGYRTAFVDQKTTLRQKCIQNDCLASAIDNILIPPEIEWIDAQAIHFYNDFNNIREARKISDHLPIRITLTEK